MNNPKERTAWIKAQEAAADEDPHGYPEPGEPNESTEERMQRFFFQQVTEGNATADGDGVQTLTVTITLAEYRRLAQQDGKLEYLQEQLDKKGRSPDLYAPKSIEDDKAASNYRRQIEDLNRDRRNLAENANIVANAEQKTRESLERANARIEELTQDIIRVEKNRDAAWERFSEVSKQLDAAEARLRNKTLALTSLLNDLEALGVEPKKHNTEEEQK